MKEKKREMKTEKKNKQIENVRQIKVRTERNEEWKRKRNGQRNKHLKWRKIGWKPKLEENRNENVKGRKIGMKR